MEGVFLLPAAEGFFTYSPTVMEGEFLVVVEEGGIEEGRWTEGGAEPVFFWDVEVLPPAAEGVFIDSPTVVGVFLGTVVGVTVLLVLVEGVF